MGDRENEAGEAGTQVESLARQRETFLAHFAVNCHVAGAAGAAGIKLTRLFGWRRTDPDFAAQWAEAQTAGYQMLEARLMAHALAGGNGERLEGVDGTPLDPINVELAMKLMSLRQSATGRNGLPKRPGRPLKRVSDEDTLKVLLDRLDLIERRRRDEAARLAGTAAPRVIEHRQGERA